LQQKPAIKPVKQPAAPVAQPENAHSMFALAIMLGAIAIVAGAGFLFALRRKKKDI